MKRIDLTNEEYDQLIAELVDGECHRHNSDSVCHDDCPSKLIPIVESRAQAIPDQG